MKPTQQTSSSPLAAALLGFSLLGCVSEGEFAEHMGIGGVDVALGGPCSPGQERHCSVTMSQGNGQLRCYHGLQVCEEGTWTACQDGEEVRQLDPTTDEDGNPRDVLALSTPTACADNPCDPTCMVFDEDPTPDYTAIPGTVITPGPPPSWASTPGTATCAHNLCVEDVPLPSACHPCVANVCTVDPTCCSDLGSPDAWDTACVALVASECAPSPIPADPISVGGGVSICDYAMLAEGYMTLADRPWIEGAPIGAVGNLNLGTNAKLDDVFVNGNASLNNGDIYGDVYAAGTISGTATVGGMSVPGSTTTFPAIPTKTNAEIGCQSSGATQNINCNSWSINPGTIVDGNGRRGTDKYNFSSCSDLTLSAPGNYGPMENGGGKIYIAQPGHYTFPTLNLDGASAGLIIPNSGTVYIDVCNELQFQNGATIEKANGDPPDPFQVIFYTNDTTVKLGVGAQSNMILVAPHATLTGGNYFGGDSTMLFAENIDLQTDVHMNATGMTGQDCIDASVDMTDNCGTWPNWQVNGAYISGAKVQNNGNIYTCLVPGWCELAAYEPGVGAAGAWTDEGACPAPAAPIICSVNLDLPGTGPLTETCYTGLECQNNTRCTEPVTNVSCGALRSKCARGDALDATCDSCVNRICADPSFSYCCDDTSDPGAWDQSCVDAVKTHCDADCGAAPTNPCSHDMCDTGAPLSGACDACAADVCSLPGMDYCCGNTCAHNVCSTGAALGIGCSPDAAAVCQSPGFEYCCTDTWDQACVSQVYIVSDAPSVPADGRSVCDFSVLGSGSANFYGTEVYGDAGWYGGTLGLYSSSVLYGNIYTGGASTGVVLNGVNVVGEVEATGSVSVSGSTVSNGWRQFVANTLPSRPTRTWSCPHGSGTVYSSAVKDASDIIDNSVNYGTIIYNVDATLEPGNYYVGQMQIKAGVTVTLPATGFVNVYACNGLLMETGSRLLSPSNNRFQLDYWVNSGNITMQSSEAWGAFRTSGGAIALQSGADLYGIAHAYTGSVTTQSGSIIDTGGADRSICLARGIDTNWNPGSCPTSPVAGTWDQGCVDAVYNTCQGAGNNLCDYAVYGYDRVSGGGGGSILGGAIGGGTENDLSINSLNVGGSDIFAGQDLYLYSTNIGNAYANGTTIYEDGGSSSLSQTTSAGLDFPELSFDPVTCGGVNRTFTGTGNAMNPGSYGDITINDNTDWELRQGAYNINNLSVGNSNTRLLLPTSGKVILNVCGNFNMGSNVEVALVSGSISPADALRFEIRYHNTPRIYVGSTTNHFYGVITGPEAEVFVRPSSYIIGMVRGDDVDLGGNSVVDATGLTGSACEAAGVGEPYIGQWLASNTQCDFAFLSNSGLGVYGGTVSGGAIGAAAIHITEDVPAGTASYIDGNVSATGSLAITNSTVTGTAQSAGAYVDSGSTVGPGSGFNPSLQNPPGFPTESYPCPTAATVDDPASPLIIPNATINRTLDPGIYNDLHREWFGSGAPRTLTLKAGRYTLHSMVFDPGTQLVLPATGVVELFICGRIVFKDGASVVGPGGSPLSPEDAFRLNFYTSSGVNTYNAGSATSYDPHAIEIHDNVNVTGVFRAPNGSMSIGEDSIVTGIIHANNGTMRRGATILSDGLTGEACKTSGFFDPTRTGGECTVETPPGPKPPESGTCVANGTTYDDSASCSGADLAIEVNCDDDIFVCNHGGSDVSANDARIGFYARSGQQMGVEFPDNNWLMDTCVIDQVVPAGACVTQACPAIWAAAADYTMMVNYDDNGALGECSLLDNWSYFDSTRSCTTPAMTEVQIEDYEMICPSDAIGSWGLLAWTATTPGLSTITFEAATADTAAGLAAAPYTTLQMAQAGPPDTQNCPFTSPLAECPVDLTDTLWPAGNNNQPQHMRVRITLTPDGSDSPVLDWWQMTYSCVVDQ